MRSDARAHARFVRRGECRAVRRAARHSGVAVFYLGPVLRPIEVSARGLGAATRQREKG